MGRHPHWLPRFTLGEGECGAAAGRAGPAGGWARAGWRPELDEAWTAARGEVGGEWALTASFGPLRSSGPLAPGAPLSPPEPGWGEHPELRVAGPGPPTTCPRSGEGGSGAAARVRGAGEGPRVPPAADFLRDPFWGCWTSCGGSRLQHVAFV